jgi:hypothetical protein
MLHPLLYSLFTHDCMATPPTQSSTLKKTVVGLITNNDETAYREEVRALALWCQENNLSFNVNKMKEPIVDFRKKWREHAPIHINRTWPLRPSETFTDAHLRASCQAVSTPGTATAPPTTVRLSRG